MSLVSWGARKLALKWERDAEQGKKGAVAMQAVKWLKAHKGPLGIGLGAVYALLVYLDPSVPQAHAIISTVNPVLDKLVPFLLGAGFLDSDFRHKQTA